MYLVRIKKEYSPFKQIIGVFAGSLDDICYTIDEVTDPSMCEYRRISSGGIFLEPSLFFYSDGCTTKDGEETEGCNAGTEKLCPTCQELVDCGVPNDRDGIDAEISERLWGIFGSADQKGWKSFKPWSMVDGFRE
jgi:hypothetical protein